MQTIRLFCCNPCLLYLLLYCELYASTCLCYFSTCIHLYACMILVLYCELHVYACTVLCYYSSMPLYLCDYGIVLWTLCLYCFTLLLYAFTPPHLYTGVPDKFLRQGVNKEFQWVNSHCFHHIIINFLFICWVMYPVP